MTGKDDDKPNSDMLRHDIDRGKTGDKIGVPDPAAAPLGTDDEAGGNPPTEEQLRIAREAETRRPDEKEASRNRPIPKTGDE